MSQIADPDNPNIYFDERVVNGALQKVQVTKNETVNSNNTVITEDGWVEVNTKTVTTVTTTRVLTEYTV